MEEHRVILYKRMIFEVPYVRAIDFCKHPINAKLWITLEELVSRFFAVQWIWLEYIIYSEFTDEDDFDTTFHGVAADAMWGGRG